MKKGLLLLALFTITLLGFSYDLDVKNKEYSLKSPYYSILSHLKHLQPDTYHPKIAAKAFHGNYTDEEKEEFAIQLKQILDGNDLYVYAHKLPQDKSFTDSVSKDSVFILFDDYPQIRVEKIGENWYYAESTISAIPDLYDDVMPWWSQQIIELIPDYGHIKVIGNIQIWQILGLFILIVFSVVLQKVLVLVLNKVIKRIVHRFDEKEVATQLITAVSKPIGIIVISWFLIETITVLKIPIKVTHFTIQVLQIVLALASIVVFYKLVDLICMILANMAAKTESTLDDQLIPLLSKALKVFVVTSGGLVILQNLDIEITALLAGLSIGGLAFALAAQDTIKNLFGSIMIFIDRPFQIGDWIITDKINGTVEEVGFRSTRIRTFANSLVTVPNGKLADLTVDNMGKRAYRRYSTHFGITYDTPPSMIETFVDGIKEIIKIHPNTRKDYYEIHLNDLGSSSIDILIYVFFEVPDWSQELNSRHDFILEVLKLAEELGVNFAFPTQTLHIESFPEKAGNHPNYNEVGQKDNLQSYLENYKSRVNKPAEGDK